MRSLFAPLAVKIGAITIGVLLVALLIQGLQLRSARSTIEQQRNAMAACDAARRVQNAAIREAEAEGQRQREAYQSAVEAGERARAEAQNRRRIVRQTAPNGCPTPPQIREAGL